MTKRARWSDCEFKAIRPNKSAPESPLPSDPVGLRTWLIETYGQIEEFDLRAAGANRFHSSIENEITSEEHNKTIQAMVGNAVYCLESELQRFVIIRRYGLDGGSEHTLGELAKQLRCSVKNVWKLEKRAFAHLKRLLG